MYVYYYSSAKVNSKSRVKGSTCVTDERHESSQQTLSEIKIYLCMSLAKDLT